MVFPIIKHLWTSSMVLFAGGWSFLLLALFYLLIDVWGLRKWAFGFMVIGMNAITVYMVVHVFDAAGVSIGRNAFQHEKPDKIIEALCKMVHNNVGVEDAIQILKS